MKLLAKNELPGAHAPEPTPVPASVQPPAPAPSFPSPEGVETVQVPRTAVERMAEALEHLGELLEHETAEPEPTPSRSADGSETRANDDENHETSEEHPTGPAQPVTTAQPAPTPPQTQPPAAAQRKKRGTLLSVLLGENHQ